MMNTDGLSSAPMIAPGATVEAATWHIAGHYGPGPAHPTERDALVALIDAMDRRERDERDAEGLLPASSLTIDLRWALRWPPGSTDANGRPNAAVGAEVTIMRTTYTDLADARAHLARIDRVYGPLVTGGPTTPVLGPGDSYTITHTLTLGENT
jgi:hypothetical protein